MCGRNHRFRLAVMVALGAFIHVVGCGCELDAGKPDGDAQHGAALFVSGDGTGSACQSCHCSDAGGGCRLLAPDIRGATYEQINTRIRDSRVQHPGGEFAFTVQDVADLEAYLAGLDSG